MYNFNLTQEELNLVKNLETKLGLSFRNKQLLIVALTHSSYVGKLKKMNRLVYTYERLEFLGDAVLELIVSDFLVRRYKKQSEGILSATRAFLVNEQALAKTARRLGLYNYAFVGKSFISKLQKSDHVLSDILESIIGAVYLDRGFRKAKRFVINKHLSSFSIYKVIKNKLFLDSKTRLQELVQKLLKITPIYETKTIIKNNKILFTSCVKIQEVVVACAQGATKLEAEFKAAAKTLDLLKNKKKLNKILEQKNVKN